MKPDYSNAGLVNLMASIYNAVGYPIDSYPSLGVMDEYQIGKSRNIVFMLMDGLGYEYVKQQGANSYIEKNTCARLSSVFPTTTSSALTTLASGLAPQQHAVTGWFMYLKELGMVSAILPFRARIGGETLSTCGVLLDDVIDIAMAMPRITRKSTVVSQRNIVDSDYSLLAHQGAEKKGYTSLSEYFRHIYQTVMASDEAKYIYAYWPSFDEHCHVYGVDNPRTKTHFAQIDQQLEQLVSSLQGSDTTIVLTADHGLLDTNIESVINLDKYPNIMECLSLPLSGEPRTAYCNIRMNMAQQFENRVLDQLSNYCDLHRSADLIAENYFGFGEVHPQLNNRIGDYVLLAKNNYVIKDRVLGEGDFSQIGVHGGLSDQELYVPLVVFQT